MPFFVLPASSASDPSLPLPLAGSSVSSVRLLVPSAPSTALSSLTPASSSAYHARQLQCAQRTSVAQGELLQFYLSVPRAMRDTFPWLWDGAHDSDARVRPAEPLSVLTAERCAWRADVRLRVASIRGEEKREDDGTKSPPDNSISPRDEEGRPLLPFPHQPTPLHLSSTLPAAGPAEPSSNPSPAVWSRFTNRFQRKAAPSLSSTSSLEPSSGSSPAALLTSPVSAPAALDPAAVPRPEVRRARSTNTTPSHIPSYVQVAPQSAFQHDPPSGRGTVSGPVGEGVEEGGVWVLRLSTGDVAVVMESVMMAAAGLVWLEVEVHSPTSHRPSDLSSPAVLRAFIADQRVLRLPPPHPIAGALLQLACPVHVVSAAAVVCDRVVINVTLECAQDVLVQGCDVLLQFTRWVKEGRGQGRGDVSVPIPLASLVLLSSHHVTFPVELRSADRYSFLSFLDPLSSMAHVQAELARLLVSALLDHPAPGHSYGEALQGAFLTSCVVTWRAAGASTAIASQHEVRWTLPMQVKLRGGESDGSEDRPSLTLAHPPTVRLHQMFAVSATVHNVFTVPLTFTLHVLHHHEEAEEQLTASTTSAADVVGCVAVLARCRASAAASAHGADALVHPRAIVGAVLSSGRLSLPLPVVRRAHQAEHRRTPRPLAAVLPLLSHSSPNRRSPYPLLGRRGRAAARSPLSREGCGGRRPPGWRSAHGAAAMAVAERGLPAAAPHRAACGGDRLHVLRAQHW